LRRASASNSGSGGSIQFAAQLAGNGNVEYRGYSGSTFQPTWICSLNISGSNNTYSGTWHVVRGTLVGSGMNALGTNTITVDAAGALQTTYAIYNPQGDLILNGRLNLTQNHRFRAVTIGGVLLAPGQYSFAQLNAAYPANFPATWIGQTGVETQTSASGSITVIGSFTTASYPTNITFSVSGSTLSLSWPATHLGWILQNQTNSIATGLSTNWLDVPGTATVTSTNITVSPIIPTAFYRLRHP